MVEKPQIPELPIGFIFDLFMIKRFGFFYEIARIKADEVTNVFFFCSF